MLVRMWEFQWFQKNYYEYSSLNIYCELFLWPFYDLLYALYNVLYLPLKKVLTMMGAKTRYLLKIS